MSLIYTSEGGYKATDCPTVGCGQEVRLDRAGDEFRFTCRGGCGDDELRPLLPPQVMLELAAATEKAPNGNAAVARDLPEVDGAELLDAIAGFITRFVVLPSAEHADLLALWVLHTHALEAAFATPYLRITSAAPNSGKTQLLEVLATVVRRGWHAINPSTAVLYRKIDRDTPTLLLDEMDNYPVDERRDALAVLNAGYKRGARVDRCRENGELETFSCFCAKAYAGLDKHQLVDTLLSRSITLRLERKLRSEPVDMWIGALNEHEADPIRERCEVWAAHNLDRLTGHEPQLPDVLFNRSAEVWWALLALGEVVGGDWAARTRAAAVALTTGGDERDGRDEPVLLLQDLSDAFGGSEVASTHDLLAALNAIEESPWGIRRRGEGIDARGLAKLLRPFRIKSRTVRPEGQDGTARGYRLDQFEDAFARHLLEATQATQVTQTALGLERDVSDVSDVSDFQPRASDEEEAEVERVQAEVERVQGKFGDDGGAS